MNNKIFNVDNLGMSSYFVRFKNAALEQEYGQANVAFLKQSARVGMIIAAISWILVAVMEPMIAPLSYHIFIWLIAVVALGFSVLVFSATYTTIFNQYHQPIILVGVITTILSVCIKIKLFPVFSTTHYMPVVMCITLWLFSVTGLAIRYALIIGLLFYAYIDMSLVSDNTSGVDMIACIYYMLVSYFMGAAICVNQELQSRKIFIAYKALDNEKQQHYYKSLHDTLTKLPNRELLEDRLSQAISLSRRKKIKSAGLFIDLDKFKSINDHYGHYVGDLYLKEVVNRLLSITRDADTLARLGGDEFFLLLLEVGDEEAVLQVVHKIQTSLNEQFVLSDKLKVKGLGASIGICMLPYAKCTPQNIINRADKEMYHVKHQSNSDADAR